LLERFYEKLLLFFGQSVVLVVVGTYHQSASSFILLDRKKDFLFGEVFAVVVGSLGVGSSESVSVLLCRLWQLLAVSRLGRSGIQSVFDDADPERVDDALLLKSKFGCEEF
jgi:hypothetical protein